jgi:hypothetical protein
MEPFRGKCGRTLERLEMPELAQERYSGLIEVRLAVAHSAFLEGQVAHGICTLNGQCPSLSREPSVA